MSKYLKEGEAVPFGYGFVSHRLDMLATEVAPVPLNIFIRLIRWLQFKSFRQMTREEIKTSNKINALLLEAEAKGKEKGWREGSQGAWKEVTKIYMDGAYGDKPSPLTDKKG